MPKRSIAFAADAIVKKFEKKYKERFDMTSCGVCDVIHYGQTSDKKMKNTRIIEMYGEMLRQLKSRLDQADAKLPTGFFSRIHLS